MEFEDFKSKLCSTDGDSVYIVFSTENHLVNYIPLVLADAVGKANMKYCTIENSSKNKTWDERFTEFYRKKTNNTEEIKSHKFSRQQILEKKKFKESIENAIGSSTEVFWNFTGGQRIWILSALPYIIEDKETRNHHILYVEGNEEQLKVVSYLKGQEPKNESFSFKDSEFKLAEKLELNDLFSFMDFKSIKSNSYYEKGKPGTKFDQLIYSFGSFFDGYAYLLKRKSNDLLDKLIDLNREETFSDLESFKDENFNINFEWAKVKVFIDSELGEDDDGVSRIEKKGTKLFGYILEYLVLYKICHLIKENDKIKERIAGLWHSVKIDDNQEGVSGVDEFDILILTTGGKVIVLECKSGKMSGDVAKSTNYSTYAIAGVYGMPLFSSPLLFSTRLSGKNYKTLRQAHNSAKRARLDILYIDKIEEKLKELLNI